MSLKQTWKEQFLNKFAKYSSWTPNHPVFKEPFRDGNEYLWLPEKVIEWIENLLQADHQALGGAIKEMIQKDTTGKSLRAYKKVLELLEVEKWKYNALKE